MWKGFIESGREWAPIVFWLGGGFTTALLALFWSWLRGALERRRRRAAESYAGLAAISEAELRDVAAQALRLVRVVRALPSCATCSAPAGYVPRPGADHVVQACADHRGPYRGTPDHVSLPWAAELRELRRDDLELQRLERRVRGSAPARKARGPQAPSTMPRVGPPGFNAPNISGPTRAPVELTVVPAEPCDHPPDQTCQVCSGRVIDLPIGRFTAP